MEVDTAVAVGLALEAQRQPEILVVLLGHEVAVLLGHPLAVNGAVLDGPVLGADFRPAGEVLSVEQTRPTVRWAAGWPCLRGSAPGKSPAGRVLSINLRITTGSIIKAMPKRVDAPSLFSSRAGRTALPARMPARHRRIAGMDLHPIFGGPPAGRASTCWTWAAGKMSTTRCPGVRIFHGNRRTWRVA